MKTKIYVELDALLDTRIAVVDELSPEAAVKMLSRDYWDRQVDDFSAFGVDQTAYLERYRTRDGQILQRSRLTAIGPVINEIVMQLERETVHGPIAGDVEVHVNTHPFNLLEEERKAIQIAVSAHVGVNARVKVVHIATEHLTPSEIKQEYSAVFMYNFEDWLTTHGELIFQSRMPTVIFVVPALYRERVPDQDEVHIDDAAEVSPFATLEHFMIETISLHMVNPQYFSIIEP